MIDVNDKKTLSLIPEKRGRGRPKTGTAMTAAQKQKAYRERNKHNVTVNSIENLNETIELRQKLFDALKQIEILEKANAEIARALQEKINLVKALEKGNVTKNKRHRDDPAKPLKAWAVFGKKSIRNKTWVRITPEGDEHDTEAEAKSAMLDAPSMGPNAVYTALEVTLP